MREKGLISIDDVLQSRSISSPFHLLDCSVPCEGGAAVLVTSGDIARRINPQPAYIKGFGEYHGNTRISQRNVWTTLGSYYSGKQAFTMAGILPKEIDIVELYDAFTINPIIYLEDLGFCEKGKGRSIR